MHKLMIHVYEIKNVTLVFVSAFTVLCHLVWEIVLKLLSCSISYDMTRKLFMYIFGIIHKNVLVMLMISNHYRKLRLVH